MRLCPVRISRSRSGSGANGSRFLKAHGDGDRAAWEKELAELEAESRSDAAQLPALNAELNEMKGIRFCVNKVLAVNGQTQSGQTKVEEKQAER